MNVAVVGSGPSGMAAASALLEAGHAVDILDVGTEPEEWSRDLAGRIREASEEGRAPSLEILRQLKGDRTPPGIGRIWRGLATVLGGGVGAELVAKRILGSTFVFSGIETGIPVENAMVPRSLAKGGLSNVWGAACFPLREVDFEDWPIAAPQLAPYYARAAEMLGLVQHVDGLARAYPLHGAATSAIARNPGSAAERLLSRWSLAEPELKGHGLAAGRTRLAVRETGRAGDSCRLCGLCFYGCSFGSIYTSTRTLRRLEGREGFAYRPGLLVLDFREEAGGVVVRSRRVGTEEVETHSYDALFLAAGTLSSLRIAADSLAAHHHAAPLLDNDMYLLPVVLRRDRVSSRFRSAFTLGEAVLATDPGAVAPRGLHIQLYQFHEYFLAGLDTFLGALPRAVQRAAWGVLNNFLIAFVYLPGSYSAIATAQVRKGDGADPIGRVRIDLQQNPESRAVLNRLLRHLWRARRDVGFLSLTPLVKATPLGFSGHLAGTLSMRRNPGLLETDCDGILSGTRRVHVVDAAVFPALPAQNLTFTTVANAMRVADAFSSKSGS